MYFKVEIRRCVAEDSVRNIALGFPRQDVSPTRRDTHALATAAAVPSKLPYLLFLPPRDTCPGIAARRSSVLDPESMIPRFRGRQMLRRRVFVVALLILIARVSARAADPLADFDKFAESIRTEWKVPGMSVAIVRDGQVLLCRGYGFRDSEKKLPVTARTLFAIGSISKSFTAVGLGILVDQGKLDWKTPVRDHLPTFRLKDPVANDHTTPLDLLSHRTGLPRHDLIWYASGLKRGEILETFRYLEPSREFRESWQYNNLMYVAAGSLDEHISGVGWEELTRLRILKPLGMSSTNFSVRESQRTDDHAFPYAKVSSEVRRIAYYDIDALAPAGGINSNAEDMARYLQFHIDKGAFAGRRILSEKTADRLQTSTMVIEPVDATGLNSPKYDEVGTLSYGLGFFLGSYRGRKVVWHSGSIDGFSALFSFLPREKIGVLVLTNLSGHRPVPICVTRNAFDRLLGLDPVDWNARRMNSMPGPKSIRKYRKPGKRRHESLEHGSLMISPRTPGALITQHTDLSRSPVPRAA